MPPALLADFFDAKEQLMFSLKTKGRQRGTYLRRVQRYNYDAWRYLDIKYWHHHPHPVCKGEEGKSVVLEGTSISFSFLTIHYINLFLTLTFKPTERFFELFGFLSIFLGI